MKDYFKDFKESDSAEQKPNKKKISVDFTNVSWIKDKQNATGFELGGNVKKVPIPPLNKDGLSSDEIRGFAAEVVLNFLNEEPDPQDPSSYQLSDKHKQDIESRYRHARRNPGFMSTTIGTDKDDHRAYIGVSIDPTAKRDWIKAKEHILYTLPIEYKEDLEHFISELQRKIDRESEKPKHISSPIDKEKALDNLRNAMKLDWYAHYSDDMAIRNAGAKSEQALRNALEIAAKVDPEAARNIAKQQAPKLWHQWIDQVIEKAKMNK
jgi:hypothetical protein